MDYLAAMNLLAKENRMKKRVVLMFVVLILWLGVSFNAVAGLYFCEHPCGNAGYYWDWRTDCEWCYSGGWHVGTIYHVKVKLWWCFNVHVHPHVWFKSPCESIDYFYSCSDGC